MKRLLLWTSFGYAIAGMAGGVFYREFTRFMGGFSERTTLSFLHTHLFMLGVIVFLVAFLLDRHLHFSDHKLFWPFYGIYNAGLVVTVAGLLARGITQVQGAALSSGGEAAISGVSGLGHIALGTGIILLFIMLLKRAKRTAA